MKKLTDEEFKRAAEALSSTLKEIVDDPRKWEEKVNILDGLLSENTKVSYLDVFLSWYGDRPDVD